MNLIELAEGLDLSELGRASWEREQAIRDLELLWWIGRFRLVTAQAISDRFEISLQRANSRVRRFERLRLVGTAQRSLCESRAVFLSGRGAELLGQPRRRPPRPDVQREHEEAIMWLSTQLERQHDGGAVRTERECRRRESDRIARYSVPVVASGRRSDRTRWPDLVVEESERRTAYEIEFSSKHTPRLQAILRGYTVRGTYDEVVFLARTPSLARRLQSLARAARPSPHLVPKQVDVRVEPFPDQRRVVVGVWRPPFGVGSLAHHPHARQPGPPP